MGSIGSDSSDNSDSADTACTVGIGCTQLEITSYCKVFALLFFHNGPLLAEDSCSDIGRDSHLNLETPEIWQLLLVEVLPILLFHFCLLHIL